MDLPVPIVERVSKKGTGNSYVYYLFIITTIEDYDILDIYTSTNKQQVSAEIRFNIDRARPLSLSLSLYLSLALSLHHSPLTCPSPYLCPS